MTTRMRTRAIVIVHSHIQKAPDNGVVDLSADVIAISTSKSITGAGGASVTLVPRRNYLNYLFPNDMINIYFDPGDGERGFVRTFLGYIDRVERSESTDGDGTVSTAFNIVCTDFTKVIDRTEIYFNPYLSTRNEFIDPDFGLSKLGGGTGLRTKGITVHGTPADIVENMLGVLLGFGSQWVIPTSYPQGRLKANREVRSQRSMQRVPQALADQLTIQTGLTLDQYLTLSDDKINELLRPDRKNFFVGSDKTYDERYKASRAVFDEFISQNSVLEAHKRSLQISGSTDAPSFLDLLDLSFIEAMSMDGFIASASVWTGEGTLASLLYGYSNSIVNELCFDLRPVASDSKQIGVAHDSCFGETYSRNADELGINVNGNAEAGFPASVPGVQYVPAVIMREYPFSTVEGLDLTHLYLLNGEVSLEFVPFGPIFIKGANDPIPGRKIYDYSDIPEIKKRHNALADGTCFFERGSKPLKHLDVVPIRNTDVISSSVGRSDHDTYNYYSVYANDSIQKVYKFLLQEFMPIVNPSSIVKHGLRVFEQNTKFANWGRTSVCESKQLGSAIDNNQIRRNLIRWTTLLEHWNQHNAEYLNGSIRLRGMPEIRVGYRLDWLDRNESYYVQQVTHQWSYPGTFTTQVQVVRGQRNDPFPAYIPPIVSKTFGQTSINPTGDSITLTSSFAQQGGGNRKKDGRLSDFFEVKDTHATARSVEGRASFSNIRNEIDVKPNANRGGVAIYPEDIGVRNTQISELRDSDMLEDYLTREERLAASTAVTNQILKDFKRKKKE